MSKTTTTNFGDNLAETASTPSQKAERLNPVKRWEVISKFLGDSSVTGLLTLKVLVDVVNLEATVDDLDEQSLSAINSYLNEGADAETNADPKFLTRHRMRRGYALVNAKANCIPMEQQSKMKDFINEIAFVLDPAKDVAHKAKSKVEESCPTLPLEVA